MRPASPIASAAARHARNRTTGRPRPSPLAAGTLVLVTGSDPAVNAQVLVILRRRLVAEAALFLPQLVLDRPVWSGEQHIPVARTQFQEMAARGFFLATWQAFGTWHGVPATTLKPPIGAAFVVVAAADAAIAPLRTRWREAVIVEVDGGPSAVLRRRQPPHPAHAGARTLRLAHRGDIAEAARDLGDVLLALTREQRAVGDKVATSQGARRRQPSSAASLVERSGRDATAPR